MDKTLEYLTELRKLLAARFNTGELRTLCFDLGVDYEDLPGESKADKARELVSYCERRDCLDKLVQIGRQLRPDVPWQTPAATGKPGASAPVSTIAGNGNVIGNGNVVQIIKAEGSTISGVTQIGGDAKRKKKDQ
jgi:hypothetical protein